MGFARQDFVWVAKRQVVHDRLKMVTNILNDADSAIKLRKAPELDLAAIENSEWSQMPCSTFCQTLKCPSKLSQADLAKKFLGKTSNVVKMGMVFFNTNTSKDALTVKCIPFPSGNGKENEEANSEGPIGPSGLYLGNNVEGIKLLKDIMC